MKLQYVNFDVKIRRGRPDYQVHVSSPAGEAHASFRAPEELADLLPSAETHRGHRHLTAASTTAVHPMESGRSLFDALFYGDVRDRFSVSIGMLSRRQGLRIRLWLADVPELASLPWEHLREANFNQPLALSLRTPIVRYLELGQAERPIPAERPLRVLVVGASPAEFCRLDLGRESFLLVRSLSRLTRWRQAVVDHLENATLPAVVERLAQTQYHVLHFMGHGVSGSLLFEGEQGRAVPVPFHQLADLLSGHGLRLIVLNACEGAGPAGEGSFDGVAQSLVQKGIPAVVAMQFPISDQVSLRFTHDFYRSLAEGQPVEAAITRARRAIYAGERSSEWITPVLYTRLDDGRIIPPVKWGWTVAVGGAALAFAIAVGLWKPLPQQVGSQSSSPPPSTRPCRTAAPNPPECPTPPGLEMSFVKIEPGSFSMGEEKGGDEDEPVHQVTLSRPFCLGRYEVTQRQWMQIMGSNPSSIEGMELPVQRVSWEAAKEFVAKLNEGERGSPYRLATEAEWEYAARAGQSTRYSFGDDPSLLSLYGNCLSRDRDDGFDRPAPFGSFKANPWGLCDMYGNVWEWVSDWNGKYPSGAVSDPLGPTDGVKRVKRGGSWGSRLENCRSATRSSGKPGSREQDIGLRLVREIQ